MISNTRNKLLTQATTWINLMPKSQKLTYCVIPLTQHFEMTKLKKWTAGLQLPGVRKEGRGARRLKG